MAMKLSPRPNALDKELQESFENVLTKFKRATLAKDGQEFSCVFEEANLNNTKLKQILKIDYLEDCKFSLHVKIECNKCAFVNHTRDYEDHYDLDSCSLCNDRLHITLTVRNDGRAAVKANITIKIEKIDLSVKEEILNVAKHFEKKDTHRQSWQFKPSSTNGYCIYDGLGGPFYGGNFFDENGSLTFICNIKILEVYGQSISKITKWDSKFPGVLSKLAEHFSDKNINPTTTEDKLIDVILCVGNDKVHCHKLVLSLTSKFFERMFATDMKESRSKEIILEGIDLETLKSLLTFMYNDTISSDKIDTKLLIAADMYEVMRLRAICIDRLSRFICLKNVLEVFSVAYDHCIEELCHDAVAFMTQNWKELSKDYKVWKFAEQYPKLIFTISALLSRK